MMNIRPYILSILILCFTFIDLKAQEERNILSSSYTQQDVEEALVQNDEWISFPEYNDREAWLNVPESLREQYIKEGEKYLDYEWTNVNATDYLEFVRSGNREIMETPYGKNIKALEKLVMAELLEGEGRFIDDIINVVWQFCEMTYWGNSAHLTLQEKGAGLPDINEPTIDLGVGKVSTNLAWTYHFFKDEFDNVNPIINQRIKHEIDRKVLDPYYSRNDFWWMGFGEDFVNNWNPWVNYNVLNNILLVEEDIDKKSKYLYKVMRSIDQFINYYPDDGGSDEGPAYWSHAGGKLFDVLELISRATEDEVNIFDEKIIGNIGSYIYKAYINDKYFINFADASNKITPSPGTVFRYGSRINDPQMKGFGAYLAKNQDYGNSVIDGKIELTLENLFRLEDINSYPSKEPLIKNFWLPETQVAGVREARGTNNGFYFAAKGGHNGESHNHNDVGSFILYYNGKPAIVDAGVGTYTAKTFSSQRYEIWTMQSLYHNLPVINDTGQKEGNKYAANTANFVDKDDVAKFNVEIAGAYPKSAEVKNWDRKYILNRKKQNFSIIDEFNLAQINGQTSLNFLSSCEVKKAADGRAEIIGEGFKLSMKWDPSQFDFKVEDIKLNDQKLIEAWPNGLRRILLYRTKKSLSDTSKIIFEQL